MKDLKTELKHLYTASARQTRLVDVPGMNYLLIDGEGDPNSAPEFQQSIEALYGIAYTLKFMLKKGPEAVNYTVMPLEALWWSGEGDALNMEDKSSWRWRLLVAQPDCVKQAHFRKAVEALKAKKDNPAIPKVRFEKFHEGACVQVLHIGPYATEAASIAKLHEFAAEAGLRISGKHHEIYLSDPRRSAPEKLKTILRQAVRKQSRHASAGGSGN